MERTFSQARQLRLLPASPDHAEVLYRIFTGYHMRQHNPVTVQPVATLRKRLETAGHPLAYQAPFYRWFAEYDGEVIGTFTLKNVKWWKGSGEIGYGLLDDFQGQGWGKALVWKSVNHLLTHTSLQKLWATVSVPNTASWHILEGLGFQRTKILDKPFIILGKPVPQYLYELYWNEWGNF